MSAAGYPADTESCSVLFSPAGAIFPPSILFNTIDERNRLPPKPLKSLYGRSFLCPSVIDKDLCKDDAILEAEFLGC